MSVIDAMGRHYDKAWDEGYQEGFEEARKTYSSPHMQIPQPMPTGFPTADFYLDIMGEAIRIKEQRGTDYNKGGLELKDYFLFGNSSRLQMVWVKFIRLLSDLIDGKEFKQDSIVDMLNYTAFLAEDADGHVTLNDEHRAAMKESLLRLMRKL